MEDLAERFERHVDRRGEHHRWTGAINADRGTGRLKVEGHLMTAHRVAWELAHGPLPSTARVHPCSVDPSCVRIDHLRCESGSAPTRARSRGPKGNGSMR